MKALFPQMDGALSIGISGLVVTYRGLVMPLRGQLIPAAPEEGGGGAFNRRGPIVRLGCAKIVSGETHRRHDDS